MKRLLTLLCGACCALGAAAAGLPEIPRLAAAPVIDGRPGDPGWANALKIPFPRRRGNAFLGRTATHLFVAIQAGHGSVKDKVCNLTRHDSPVYEDDCLDFFFNISGGRNDYGQIIANVNGAVFDHLRDEQRRAVPGWDSGAKAKGSYGDDSFYIEMAVPLAALAPRGGKLGVAIAACSRWNFNSEAVLGQYHRPETFTFFRVGPFPLQCLAAQWPVFGGEQQARFELQNCSGELLKIDGGFDGRKVAFQLAPGRKRTVEFPLFQEAGKECTHVLTLRQGERPVLQLTRILTPRPVMNAVLRSDILYREEKVPLQLVINEKQTAPVLIDCGEKSVRCSYKGNTVEIPFRRIDSPWSEK